MKNEKKEMQYRYFDNQACKVAESKEDNTMIFTISDETVDRYKEIMKADGCQLEEYQKNPVVLWAHNRNQELPPIGRALWVKNENNSIKAKVEFAPTEFAQEVAKLYREGFMNGVSVGYIVKSDKNVEEDDDTPARMIIEKWELLEFSAVPVPANPNALINMRDNNPDMPELMFKDFKEWGEKKEDFCKEYICNAFPVCEVKKIETEPEKEFEDEDGKPYENEHSCRLEDPKQFDSFKRKNCEQKHDGKCIDVIYGIKENKSKIQALRYKKTVWTEAEAKAHCKDRKGTFEPAKKSEGGYIIKMETLVEMFGEEKANAVLEGKLNIIQAFGQCIGETMLKQDDIDLDTIEDGKDVEIELDKIEGSQTGLENSGEEIEITDEQYQELLSDIKKVTSDGFTGEFRRKILGKVDD